MVNQRRPSNDQLLEQLLDAIADRVVEHLAERHHNKTATAPDASPWMNIDAAAAYLDLPKQRLYRLTAQGAIPHYKQDGRLLFHRHELDDWLASYRQPSDWMSAANRAISP